jgi:hypothetical protein
VGDPFPVAGFPHVFLVHVIAGKIAGYSREQVNIGFADGLGKADRFSYGNVIVFHAVSPPRIRCYSVPPRHGGVEGPTYNKRTCSAKHWAGTGPILITPILMAREERSNGNGSDTG